MIAELDATLALLRTRGVAKATFSDAGVLTAVEFAPESSLADEPQHKASTPASPSVMRPSRAAGGLVPRATGE